MISIIIPLYNKEKAIIATLQSIREQSCPDWECVIIDDGSTDNSAFLVKKFIKDDYRFFYYHKDNGGPSSARNYGVKKAKGAWVVFLDADDYFEWDAIDCFHKTISAYPHYSCFAFNFYIEKAGKRILYSENNVTREISNPYKEWYFKRFLPGAGSVVYKKEVLQKHLHKDYLHRYEDAEMLFNIFREYNFFYSNIPVQTYCWDTLGASTPRRNIHEDFFAHLEPRGKSFWEQMILYQ